MNRRLARTVRRGIGNRLDRVRFIYVTLNPRKGLVLAGSLGCLLFALLTSVLDPSANLIFGLFGFAGIAWGLWQWGRDLLRVPHIEVPDRFPRTFFARLLPSSAEASLGFVIIDDDRVPSGTVLLSKRFNAELRKPERDWTLELDEPFGLAIRSHLRDHADELELILRYYGRKFANRDFRNESKIGVCSPLRLDSEAVRIFRTSYYESFLTNELCTRRVLTGSGPTPTELYNTNFPAEHAERIRELGTYRFANGLGVSVIGCTRDNHLVFWRQNSRAMASRGLLVPTGSGSCDWSDYQPGSSLKQLAFRAMKREYAEESLRDSDMTNEDPFVDVRMIAYFRNVRRGGKPELVALATLKASLVELVPNRQEVDRGIDDDLALREHPVRSLPELGGALKILLDSGDARQRLSVPLWVGLMAIRDFATESPEELAAFMNVPTSEPASS